MRHLYFRPPTEHNQNWFYGQQSHHVLLQRRKELKMTQQQVADKANIQLRQYQRLESGERDITGSSGRIMLSICYALKLDPFLFEGKGNEAPEIKYVILPPIETEGLTYAIPSHAYYLLVSAIPRGMVCTDDEIMDCLRKAYGKENLEIKTDYNSVQFYINDTFPYWRIVSQQGYLINSIYCSKEGQKEKLKSEGVIVKKIGNNERYCVDEFEYCRFDVNNFKITVMKTEKEILEQFKKD